MKQIRCIENGVLNVTYGHLYEVVYENSGYYTIITDKGHFKARCKSKFVVVEYPNSPHKHAKEIHAWANGASIQCRRRTTQRGDINTRKWCAAPNPGWLDNYEYRVAPDVDEEAISECERKIAGAIKAIYVANEVLSELHTTLKQLKSGE